MDKFNREYFSHKAKKSRRASLPVNVLPENFTIKSVQLPPSIDENRQSSFNNEDDGDIEDVRENINHVRITKSPKQEISKRLSLPSDIRLPNEFLQKISAQGDHASFDPENLTRQRRRSSLSEIGFGKIESYIKLDKLGEGTYATVFRGKSKLTDKIVALKEIRLEYEEGAPCTAIREVSLLRNLKQSNIVTLHDIIHTQKSLVLVFEYLERDLKQYMDEMAGVKLAMNNVRIFLFQLLRGLTYCHQRRILHRDLKPQNLLINKKGELKLADFGLARAQSLPTKTYSNEVVTLWYRPPDVLLGSTEYTTSIDMWGVGCIYYEMVTGRPLFPGQTVQDQLQSIFKKRGTPNDTSWPEVMENKIFQSYKFKKYPGEDLSITAPRLDHYGRQLLAGFLEYKMDARISANDALHHATFKPLGEAVYQLQPEESIFACKDIQLTPNPGSSRSHTNSRGRRQSMLF